MHTKKKDLVSASYSLSSIDVKKMISLTVNFNGIFIGIEKFFIIFIIDLFWTENDH